MSLESFMGKAKNYAVDVMSGSIYYTATYGLQEIAFGADSEELLKTRLIGLGVGAVIMRPVGLARNYVADKMNVTQESLFLDKLKVNVAAITPLQAIVYGGMLVASTAWSEYLVMPEPEVVESVVDSISDFPTATWLFGTAVGGLHAFPYGWFNDKIRTYFGVKAAISSSES
ncbi:L-alanine exporter AlaE [archaeon]|jgi:hypothetical protein|nr:L-alanine exporter AlaE [archaeon]MBT6762501.1 L-alanine exporter AlaE [archaeon]